MVTFASRDARHMLLIRCMASGAPQKTLSTFAPHATGAKVVIVLAAVAVRIQIDGGENVLWGGAGAPGGIVRRAAVRKRGPGSTSLH